MHRTIATVTNVSAVILGYRSGRGILLCKHTDSPSIECSLERYLKHPRTKHWFAHFHWASFKKEDQMTLQSEQQRISSCRNNPRVSRGTDLNTVLVGRAVTCVLEKNPTWQATYVALDLTRERFTIAKGHQKKPFVGRGQKKKHPAQRADLRTVAAAKDGNNLRRPWRG